MPRQSRASSINVSILRSVASSRAFSSVAYVEAESGGARESSMNAETEFVRDVPLGLLGLLIAGSSVPNEGRCSTYDLTNRRCSSGVG